MKSTISSFPHHYQKSLRLLRSELSPVKVALTCLATCVGLSAATAVEARPAQESAPLKEFAGSYKGEGFFSKPELSATGTATGTAEGVFRGRKVGGRMRLKANLASGENSIVIARNLKFKRRAMNSTTGFTEHGGYIAGAGRGPSSSKRKLLRYTDDTNFSVEGAPFLIQIVGKVRFFKRSIQVTETWTAMEQTLVFTSNLRRR